MVRRRKRKEVKRTRLRRQEVKGMKGNEKRRISRKERGK